MAYNQNYTSSGPLSLLIVDDEEIVLNATREYLTKCYPFTIDIALSGDQAISILEKIRFDVIISDYEMEGMSGIDLLRSIRARGDDTPFIIFTGRGREEVVIHAFEEGADGYIQKGGDIRSQFAELAQKINTVVRRKRAEQKLRENEEEYRILFEDAPDAYIYMTPDGIISRCNKKAEELTGRSKEELIGAKFQQIFSSSEGAEGIIERAGSLCSDTLCFSQEMEILQGEETKTVSVSLNAVCEQDKTIRMIRVVMHDVTSLKQREETLIRQEAAVQSILDNLPIGVAVNSVEPSVQFSYVNDNFARMYRVDKETLKKPDGFWDMVYPDPEIREEIMRRVITDCASGDPDRMYWTRIPIERPGEKTSYVSARNIPMPGGEEMISTVWDVTDLMEAQVLLADQKQFLNRLLETIPSPIYYKDKEGGYLGCNSSFERFIGRTKEELVGRTVFDIAPPDLAILYDEKDKELFEKQGMQEYEASLLHADGTLHNVIFYKATITDSEGNIEGIVGIILDITRIKETENELKRAQLLIEGMLNGIPDIVGLQLPDHTIIRYNKAGYEVFGLPPSEIIGKKCYELIGRVLPCERCATALALVSKESETVERYVPELKKYFECTSTPILNEKGEIDLIVEILHDISDRKRDEEAIKQVNRQLNLLSGITRHDILNNVNIIQLLLDVMQNKLDLSPVKTEIDAVETAVSRIQSEIEFTKIYQYLGTHAPQWQRLLALLSELPVPQEITFECIVQDVMLFADPLLKKVFENLLDNTLRHGKGVTTVRISSKRKEKDLIIIYEDDGRGIADEDKELIFDRGYGMNTGFGLFFIREILSITGITIQETGEAGKGARFEILVPKGRFKIPRKKD